MTMIRLYASPKPLARRERKFDPTRNSTRMRSWLGWRLFLDERRRQLPPVTVPTLKFLSEQTQ